MSQQRKCNQLNQSWPKRYEHNESKRNITDHFLICATNGRLFLTYGTTERVFLTFGTNGR